MQEELPPALPLKLQFRSFHQVAFLLTWQAGQTHFTPRGLPCQVTGRSSVESEPCPWARVSHLVPCPHRSRQGGEHRTLKWEQNLFLGPLAVPTCRHGCVCTHAAPTCWLPRPCWLAALQSSVTTLPLLLPLATNSFHSRQ